MSARPVVGLPVQFRYTSFESNPVAYAATIVSVFPTGEVSLLVHDPLRRLWESTGSELMDCVPHKGDAREDWPDELEDHWVYLDEV